MKRIKKFVPFLLVSIISSVCTFALMMAFYNTQWSNNVTEDTSYFKTVDYSTTPVAIGPVGEDFTSAAHKSVNAVVSIKNFSKSSANNFNPFDYFWGFDNGSRQPKQATGLGSGVIISKDGYIITNNHVIENSDKIEVTLNNQQTFEAKLVGTDPSTDIALLKIDETDLPFLNFYNSDDVKVGEWVLAVGNPFGLQSTVTAGIISAKGRSINLLSKNASFPIESFIQTDAAINPGNSGGALVNNQGDLIGINTAISSHTGTYEGYGFAVPANLAKKVVEDLKQYGLVQRGFLGVSTLDLTDEERLEQYNSNYKTNYKKQVGVLVTALTVDGAAIRSGIEEGDIILKVDGKKILNFGTLSSVLGSKRPGDEVSVLVDRKGKEKTFTVKLRDSSGNTELRSKDDLSMSERLGAEFQPLTQSQKNYFGIDKGVFISRLDYDSPLKNIGLSEDFIILEINDTSVSSSKEVEKELAKSKGGVARLKFVDKRGLVYQRGISVE